jgi:hypothetical protein
MLANLIRTAAIKNGAPPDSVPTDDNELIACHAVIRHFAMLESAGVPLNDSVAERCVIMFDKHG